MAALFAALGVFAGGAAGASAQAHHGGCGKVTAFDEEWLSTGLQGDLFEIKGGKIAQRNTTTQAVTALGQKLVADHTESFAEGAKLAHHLGIEVEHRPTRPQIWELEQVGGLKGSAFDSAYTHLEVLDHEEDIEDAKDEVEMGSNCLVRKEATEELPMLRQHLKLSRAAAGASG